MQLQLPPFSQFVPSLLLLLTVGWVVAWVWSVGLLATRSENVRGLPVWLWAVLLVLAPVTAAVFLLVGAPVSRRARKGAAVAAMTAVLVTVGVVAIQQIGILDCRVARRDPLTEVCEMAPRSTTLPVALGVLAAIVVGAFVVRRRHPAGAPQPLAT